MSWGRIGFMAYIGVATIKAWLAELLFEAARWLDPFNSMVCDFCSDEGDHLSEMEMRSAYASRCFVNGEIFCEGDCRLVEYATDEEDRRAVMWAVRVLSPDGERL